MLLDYDYHASSSQLLFCGILGPPAGLAMIIWSIFKMVIAASEANLIAHSFVFRWSWMPIYFTLSISPVPRFKPFG